MSPRNVYDTLEFVTPQICRMPIYRASRRVRIYPARVADLSSTYGSNADALQTVILPATYAGGEQPVSLLPRRLHSHSCCPRIARYRATTCLASCPGRARCGLSHRHLCLANAVWASSKLDTEWLCLCSGSGDVDCLECDVALQHRRAVGQV